MSRRSKAQWRELILQQQSSGLTAAEFCRRESINQKYFSTRKIELSQAASNFVEVVQPGKTVTNALPNMIQLRVIEFEVPLDILASVLDQLRQ